MMEPDLFSYPNSPGWKAEGTSKAAARAMRSRGPVIRDRVLALLKDAALTADEAAAKLGKTVLTVRPRFSELYGMKLIYNTGRTRKNASGISAAVWRAWP